MTVGVATEDGEGYGMVASDVDPDARAESVE